MAQRNILQWLEQDIYQARRSPHQHLKPSCPPRSARTRENWRLVHRTSATERGRSGRFLNAFTKLSPTTRL